MIFLGIDPGTRNIGICLADEDRILTFCTVKGKESLNKDERLFNMMTLIKNFIEGGKGIVFDKIDCAFIEYPVVFRNAKTSMILAESLGRIKSVLYGLNIPVKEVYVQEVKKIAGAMKKEDIIANTVIECEKNHWIKPMTEHEADAYWIMKVGSKRFLVDKLINNGKVKKSNHKKSMN